MDPFNSVDQNTQRYSGEDASTAAGAIINPIVFPLLKNTVSGRYIGTTGSYQMELRVDVDGTRPCNLISGDIYSVSGSVKTYYGSFKSGALAVTWGTSLVTITGVITTTWNTTYKNIKVTIPRTTIIQARAAASLTFYNASNVAGATYVCAFNSIYFRSIKLEQDYEAGASLFTSYDTNVMPHGGTGRVLNVVSAYAEAGVQMVLTAGTNSVPTSAAGANAIWTNAELETAMHSHFSIVSDSPQWQTYLLACKSKHEQTTGGSTLFGIMFDYSGTSQRQGCAVFQSQINSYYGGAGTNDVNRHTLYCYVHELGHSFNMLHSWDKGRSNSLSWMNYDWKYDQANGAGSYWANFAFQFDDQELVHIRHNFRNSVIMGGDNWNVNAGLISEEEHVDITRPMIENNTGLKFDLEAKTSFVLNEPVVVELKLRLRDLNGKLVNAMLHPNFDFVKIVIKRPSGEIVSYEGIADHLVLPKMVMLDESNPSIYESAYIGYGKDGFYFDQPGLYVLKAAYHTAEGSYISSEDIKIRVKSPVTAEEAAISELYGSDEVGVLFSLLGSDGAHLATGNAALQTVVDKYSEHPLSVYAALVLGINAGRDFKTIDANNNITVRKNDVKESGGMLKKVYDMSSKGRGVDNITLNYAMRKKAEVHQKNGEDKVAKDTLEHLRSYLGKQNLKPHVMAHINAQIERMLVK